MELSIIIPAHNEAESIAEIITKVEGSFRAGYELVIVNDHSADNTAEIARAILKDYENIRLVENLMEKGFANAVRTGFANASGDLFLPLMADLCDDLSIIPKMLEKINEGYDIVCGSRYIKGGARIGGSRLKAFLSCWGGRSLYYLLGIPTHDIANAFKMYRRQVINSINLQSKAFDISMEIPLKAYYSGFKITEIPTVWRERTKGKSTFKVFKLLPSYLKLYFWAIYKRLNRCRN